MAEERLPAPPAGGAEDLASELDALDRQYANLNEIRKRTTEHLEEAMGKSRAAPGMLGYIGKQTENLVNVEQAATRVALARADLKHKRFSQNAKLAELALEAGGESNAASLYKAAEKLSRKLDLRLAPRPASDAEIDSALEARLVGPLGTRDDSHMVEVGAGEARLEVVSLADGTLRLVDGDLRLVDPPPEGAPPIGDGERAEVETDAGGLLRATRDGVEVRVVRADMIKPPLKGG